MEWSTAIGNLYEQLTVVLLLLAAAALALFEFALFAVFYFAKTVGVLETDRIIHLMIDLLQRREFVGVHPQ